MSARTKPGGWRLATGERVFYALLPSPVGRLLVIGRHKGMASNYDCGTGCVCPASFVAVPVTPASYVAVPGETIGYTCQMEFRNCNGTQTFITPSSATWSSSNTAVATVSGSTASATAHAIAGGTAAIDASLTGTKYTQSAAHYCYSTTVTIKGPSACDVQVLGSFRVTVVSTPVSGETNSLVSGQSGSVNVEALDTTGAVMTLYRGTVQFSSGDTSATLPGNYTYTSTDNGAHTFNITVKNVGGNLSTRDLNIKDTSKGTSTTQNIFLWFKVIATREGLVNNTTACGHQITTNDHFVALPSTNLCNVGVRLANAATKLNQSVLDVGPWCPNTPGPANSNPCNCPTNPYWQTTGIPFAQTNSCSSNGAGIDLADGTFYDLGLTTNGYIYWRFQ